MNKINKMKKPFRQFLIKTIKSNLHNAFLTNAEVIKIRIFFLFLMIILVITGCTKDSVLDNTPKNLANPSAVYCVEQGYDYEIRSDEQGNQYGVCIFPDGSECSGWDYYNKECRLGENYESK